MANPFRRFAKYTGFVAAFFTFAGGLVCFAPNARAQGGACFDKVHSTSPSKDPNFDLAFDKNAQGGSFSCDLGIRASDARDAIEAFRFGVLYDSEAHIRRSISFPLSVSWPQEGNGQRQTQQIRNLEEWLEFKTNRMDKRLIALIACSSTRNVDIVKSRSYGFMIGNGDVWFNESAETHEVRVTSVNLIPLPAEVLVSKCTR